MSSSSSLLSRPLLARLLWLVPAIVAVPVALFACPTSSGEGEGEGEESDGGVEIVDSGLPAEGEGEGEGDPFELCDGGLCPDAGIDVGEYTGAEEPGVVCDGTTCPQTEQCCAVLNIAMQTLTGECSNAGTCPAATASTASCDGNEDCTDTQECCLTTPQGALIPLVACVDVGSCVAAPSNGTLVCVSTAECPVGNICCGATNGAALPVDMGLCSPPDQCN